VVPQGSAPVTGHDAGERHACYTENHVSVLATAKMASEALTVNDLSAAHNTCIRWLCEPSKGFYRETM
jgi:hypothetical protein